MKPDTAAVQRMPFSQRFAGISGISVVRDSGEQIGADDAVSADFRIIARIFFICALQIEGEEAAGPGGTVYLPVCIGNGSSQTVKKFQFKIFIFPIG